MQFEDTLDNLKLKPIPARTNDVKKLTGMKNTYRIRIGDTRIVYTIEWNDKIITIHYVGPRGDAY